MNMPQLPAPAIINPITKAWEEMAALFSGFVNATAQSNAAAMQGIEVMQRNMSGVMQETYARAVSARTSLMAAKSPKEVAQTQIDFIKDCMENLVTISSNVSEISINAAQGAMAPLTQQASEALSNIVKMAKSA